jgi:hypothetical protein
VHIIQQGLAVETPELTQAVKNGPAQAKQQSQEQASPQGLPADPRSADGIVTLSVSAAALQASDTDGGAGSSAVDPTTQEGAGQNLIDNLQDYLTSVRQGLASTNSSITGEATSSDIMSKISSLFTSTDMNA